MVSLLCELITCTIEEALTVVGTHSWGLSGGEEASLYPGEEQGEEELLTSSSSDKAFFIRRRAFANHVDTYCE